MGAERFMVVDWRDLALLRLLEGDSRTPWRRIARELDVSEATVYLRVKRLTREGVIQGYTIRVDPARLGLNVTVFALLRVKAGRAVSVREGIKMVRFVSEAYEVTGDRHFLVKITAPTLTDAAETIDELMSLEGVEDVVSFTALRRVKDGSRIVEDYAAWISHSGGPMRA